MAKKKDDSSASVPAAERLIPLERAEAEIVVVNSRFIASLAPVLTVEVARDFISDVRMRYPDATHHVPSFIIGHGNSTTSYCSDDGEPQGSSGRPLLTVVQGSGLGNIAVVVTRYFGGTKLGVGGLVRAYGDAGKAVLALVKRAALRSAVIFEVVIPYSYYDRFKILADSEQVEIMAETFEADVRIQGQILTDAFESFGLQVLNQTNGTIQPRLLARNDDAVFPIE